MWHYFNLKIIFLIFDLIFNLKFWIQNQTRVFDFIPNQNIQFFQKKKNTNQIAKRSNKTKKNFMSSSIMPTPTVDLRKFNDGCDRLWGSSVVRSASSGAASLGDLQLFR